MKFSCLMLFLCFFVMESFSQKIIEKTIKPSTQKIINIDVNIADSITIIAWNKNEIYVRASINVNDNKDNDRYDTKFNESDDEITIKAKLQNLKTYNDTCWCSSKTQINWQIYIPESKTLKVKTVNGNILITGQTGPINAYSISGYVDVSINNKRKATLNMNTITGTVYTDLALERDDNGKRNFSTIAALYNGGGDEIRLKTISGNIYVRKSEN